MNGSIAIAVDQPAGPLSWLDAIPSAHFGSCSGFAIVDWQDGQARSATVVAAPPHEEGGCMSRVRLLAGQGVTAIVTGGAGGRALMAMEQAGLPVWRALDGGSVADSLTALDQGRLERFLEGCSGHGDCGHHA